MLKKIDIRADNKTYTVNLETGKVTRYVVDGDIEGYEPAGFVLGKTERECRSCWSIPFLLAGLALFIVADVLLANACFEAYGAHAHVYVSGRSYGIRASVPVR